MFAVAIFTLLFSKCVVSSPDYYWRPFDGTVPTDALVGTSDRSENTYIGNVPIWDGGLYIGQLRSNVKQIIVTGFPKDTEGPLHVRHDFIQILCTRNAELFQWVKVNSTILHTLPYNYVIGGYEYSYMGVLYIGRVKWNGSYLIGKLVGYEHGYNDFLYVTDGEQELGFNTYEVLVYKGLK